MRAGSLFASFMSVTPLWRSFDPLPSLNKEKEKGRGDSGDEGGLDLDADLDSMFDRKD